MDRVILTRQTVEMLSHLKKYSVMMKNNMSSIGVGILGNTIQLSIMQGESILLELYSSQIKQIFKKFDNNNEQDSFTLV